MHDEAKIKPLLIIGGLKRKMKEEEKIDN